MRRGDGVTDQHRMHSQAQLYLYPTRRRPCGLRRGHRRALSRLVGLFRGAGRSSLRFLKRLVVHCGCGHVHERLRQSEPHCVELCQAGPGSGWLKVVGGVDGGGGVGGGGGGGTWTDLI